MSEIEITIGEQVQNIITATIMGDENTTIGGIGVGEDTGSAITMHNQSSSAHRDLFEPINQKIETIEEEIETFAKIDSVPTKVSQLENDKNYINDVSDKANVGLDNINQEGIGKIKSYIPKFSTMLTPFCVNFASVDASGNGNLLSYSGSSLNFNGGIIATTADGATFELASINSIALSGNGEKNIAINKNTKNAEIIGNVYYQSAQPVGTASDVWLNTSTEPLKAYQYNGTTWVKYEGIPVGSATVGGGVITKVKTLVYNQNGYNINTQTKKPFPNYSKGIVRSWNSEYTTVYDCYVSIFGVYNTSSFLMFHIWTPEGAAISPSSTDVDGKLLSQQADTSQNHGTFMCMVPKGYKYRASGGTMAQKVVEYPCIN